MLSFPEESYSFSAGPKPQVTPSNMHPLAFLLARIKAGGETIILLQADVPGCGRGREAKQLSGEYGYTRLTTRRSVKSLCFVVVLALEALHEKQHFSCIMLLIWLKAIAFSRLSLNNHFLLK